MANTTENCGCSGNGNSIDTSNIVVYDHNQCGGITADLLRMYLRPIQCYLTHQLWARIGSNQSELESARLYLETYIAAKDADPNTCEYREQLPIVQALVSRMHQENICL